MRLAVLSIAMTAAWPLAAQSQSIGFLAETVVTATRVAQPLSDLLADVTVVDRERIERSGATGLADLLGRLPGIEFQRNGGPGATTAVFLRGAESRFTAVFIDGVRIDSQSTGGAAWESIPIGQIDRIEVLRGPAAAVYGSDALSGVVQIFTKRGEPGFAPFISMGFGTYATRKTEAGFSGADGVFDYSLGLVDESSDGYNARTLSTQNSDLDGYRSRSANLKLGLQVNKANRLALSYLQSDVNSQYDNGLGKDDHNLHNLSTLGLIWEAKWTDAWLTRLSFSEAHERYETTPSPYLTQTDLRSYLLHNEVRQGQHLFTADLERKEDHLENAPINQGRSQDGFALGYGFTSQKHTVQLNSRYDNDSEFGGQSSASAAYGYALTPQWRFTTSTGTAFRAPTLFHRFSEFGLATLKPETSSNLEIGLSFAEGSRRFGAVAYRNKVENLITFSAPGPCVSVRGCYANTAQAEYAGITFTATQRLGRVSLGASLDLQDPRDLVTGNRLARRSKQHSTLTADTVVGLWTLNAEAQFASERFDDAANKKILAGYSLFNLSASTPITKVWTLLARVNNVTDTNYELASSYMNAGRSLYLGIKWAPL